MSLITNDDIAALNDIDLRRVFDLARATIIARREKREREVSRKFDRGDTISFVDSRKGNTWHMLVERVNDRTISGKAYRPEAPSMKVPYRVPFGMAAVVAKATY